MNVSVVVDAGFGFCVADLAASDLKFLRKVVSVLTRNSSYEKIGKAMLRISVRGQTPLAVATLSATPLEALTLLSVLADLEDFKANTTSLFQVLSTNRLAPEQEIRACRSYLHSLIGNPTQSPAPSRPEAGSCTLQ